MTSRRMRAAVARTAGSPLEICEVELDEPRADELLVRVVATGVCHTDINAANSRLPVPLPMILGHEGAGIVERVGSDVTEFAAGDRVLFAPDFCGKCRQCRTGHTAYCEQAGTLVFSGTRSDGTTKASAQGEPVRAGFFGQSSFAQYALLTERNLIKIDSDAPMASLAALVCGAAAGAGAVLNALRVRPDQSVAVFGVGTVGLAAVMAAKLAGAHTIVAVDRHESRLALARELGATHVVDATEAPDVAERVREAAPGGVDRSLDSTGVPEVIIAAIDSLGVRGICGFVTGTGRRLLELDLSRMLAEGKQLRPIMGGDGTGLVFLQDLIRYYDAGRLPIDRLIRTYPFERVNDAFADMESGETIKPVLVFD